MFQVQIFLGTSAGAFVCAQLASGFDPESIAQSQLDADITNRDKGQKEDQPEKKRPAPPDLSPLLAMMAKAPSDGPVTRAYLQEIGKFALAATTISQEAFILNFGENTNSLPWPEKFGCTAIDTESGEFKLWSSKDGIGLGSGIASSCSVPGIFRPLISLDDAGWTVA